MQTEEQQNGGGLETRLPRVHDDIIFIDIIFIDIIVHSWKYLGPRSGHSHWWRITATTGVTISNHLNLADFMTQKH